MELSLAVHNIVTIISGIVAAGLTIFALGKKPRRPSNITLALSLFFVVVFYVSHYFGVNEPDPSVSRNILMANVSIIFVTLFLCHTTLYVSGKAQSRRSIMIAVYVICIILAAFYLVFPDTFLIDSVPKMYFPNYYEPGELHWLMRLLVNNLIPLYFTAELIHSYVKSKDVQFRNRLKYMFGALVSGYVFGFIPVLLVYDFPVNPAWGLLFVYAFGIPFTYAAVQYELLDIKIVAKRAFFYALAIVGVGGGIILLNITSRFIEDMYPGFPIWIIPLLSAVIVVGVSVAIWKKLRESDVIKYEFITTATHKFRTPLTHIRWATENLTKSDVDADQLTQLQYIQSSTAKLVELTGILMNVSEAEGNEYEYKMDNVNLSVVTDEILGAMSEQTALKKIQIVKRLDPAAVALCDIERIRFIVQTFIENAIHYTTTEGVITVTTRRVGDEVIYSVRDTGIGISKEDLPLLFTKFYRGEQARLADTEGMGIGLFISKEIIERHHGRIWAASEGSGKGSEFSFAVPAAK